MFDYLEMMENHDGLNDHYGPEQIRDNYLRAPFGYVGGKTTSLSVLLAAMPDRRIDNEVCGGSGVWSLNRNHKNTQLKVFNDRYSGVTSFYRCLRDPINYAKMIDWLKLTIHSREEFLWCRDTWETCTDDVERACRWYYMIRQSFSQLGRNFARTTTGKSQHPQLIDNTLELFPLIHEQVKKWQIENLDAIQCLLDYDGFDTVHYIDPDYVDTDPGIYRHKVDHVRLLECIFSLKGYVALSGYANKLYDDSRWKWSDRLCWKVPVSVKAIAFTETNHQKCRDQQLDRSDTAEEVLWLKY